MTTPHLDRDSAAGQPEWSAIPLGATQAALWRGQRLHPRSPLYGMVLAFELDGELDPDAFERAFRALVASSDALRTRSLDSEAGVAWVADPSGAGAAPLEHLDLSGEPDPAVAARRWCDARATRVLDGDDGAGWLFDAALLRIGSERWVWYFAQHHSIADALSTAAAFRRMGTMLEAVERGDAPEIGGWSQFAEFVAHEDEIGASGAFERAAARWRERAGDPPPASFYGHRAQPASSTRTERVSVRVEGDLVARLEVLTADSRVRALTPEASRFTVFAAALLAFQARAAGALRAGDRASILTPVHNRGRRAFKDTLGVLIDVLPLEVELAPGDRFADLVERVRAGTRALLLDAHPGIGAHAGTAGHPVVLNYVPARFGALAGRPASARWIHPGHGDPEHALRLQVHDFAGEGALQLDFDLSCDVFGARERDIVPRHFMAILDALTRDLMAPFDAAPLMGDSEREECVVRFQRGAEAPPADDGPTFLHAFRRQVERHPERIAVEEAGSATVTYAELAGRAARVAAALRARGVAPGGLVAVAVERSIDSVAAALGAMELGAAHAPIDPDAPPARVAALLEASRPDALVVAGLDLEFGGPVLDLADAGALSETHLAEREGGPDPSALAYVLHTSGSTGRPKGTEVTHASLWSYLRAAREEYGLREDSPRVAALCTSPSVDLSVTCTFAPLSAGGRVRIHRGDGGPVDLSALDALEAADVHLLKVTPSHLALLVQRGVLTRGALRHLVIGGEDFRTSLAVRAQDALGPDVHIHNEYGPTEATVACARHRFDPEADVGASVPIGRPFAGARIYLVDERDRPVPVGVPGEVLIGGAGVAQGYRGLADETAARFTPDPFAEELGDPDARVFRTGDIARRDPATGALQFLGRRDGQAKIRGHRVEVAEVEAALEAHPDVAAAAVVAVDPRESAQGRSLADLDLELAGDPRWDGVTHCARCGLASNHPEAQLDAAGVCAVCHEYDAYRGAAEDYFGAPSDLAAEVPRRVGAEHDCIALLSGGKDSTYALYQLVRMGLRPLVFSLDNGYISDGAKANIRRVVEDLGLELVMATTSSMDAIFADSLRRFSNVCQGCFKTIYTLSTRLARERGIDRIVTGLSRGQIFETRLAPIFRAGVRDPEQVDRLVQDARRTYHRVDDAVSRHLDVELFQDDRVFDEIRYVDFYRYHDVPLDEVLRFIRDEAAWRRPEDTGRSTNCLINDVGIAVHKRVRGFHNYALPYSWDVRLGHKTRDECLDELDDDIDEARVRDILREVGAARLAAEDDRAGPTLVAHVALRAGAAPDAAALRGFVAERLPPAMVPSRVALHETLPLAPSGKVDRARLPELEERGPAAAGDPPRGEVEERLAAIWRDVLGLERVGRDEDFLAVGGDSILGLQVVTRARGAGLELRPRDLFDAPTVALLARAARPIGATVSTDGVAPEGEVPLTPIQDWICGWGRPDRFAMSVVLRAGVRLDPEQLRGALGRALEVHHALRSRFTAGAAATGGAVSLSCEIASVAPPPTVIEVDAGSHLDGRMDELVASLSLEDGAMIAAALQPDGEGAHVALVVHHMVVDAVSWSALIATLSAALSGEAVEPEAIHWRAWALAHRESGAGPLDGPRRVGPAAYGVEADAREVRAALGPEFASRLDAREGGVEAAALAALALAIEDAGLVGLAGADRLRVDVEGHGRLVDGVSADVSRTVGWFTDLRAVDVDASSEGAALDSAARRPSRTPGQGAVLFNDLGGVDASLGAAGLELVRGVRRHRAPDAYRTHDLEVHLTRERDGALAVHIVHARSGAAAAAVQAVATGGVERLRGWAAADVATAADFAGSGLSQGDLDDLLGDLDGD